MKHTISLMSITSSAIVLSSAVFAFSADQMTMPKGDSTKNAVTSATKKSAYAAKLKPQTSCPIQGEAIDKKLFVDYKGTRIYVCCEMCIADVKKDPEKAIKKLESLGQGVEKIAPVKTEKPVQKKPVAASDTSMKGMDHSKMK